MKTITKHGAIESLFIIALCLGFVAIANAQTNDITTDKAQKKVRVEVEITENGKTSTSIQELNLDRESINGQLDEMVEEIEMILEEAVRDVEETDLEITIRKNSSSGTDRADNPQYRSFISVLPEPTHPPHPTHTKSQAFLGVYAERLSDIELAALDLEDAVRIERVVKASSAEENGLQVGDIILQIEGEDIDNFEELSQAIRARQPGESIELLILRGREQMQIEIPLGERSTHRYEWTGQRPMVFEIDEEASNRAFLGVMIKNVDEKGVEVSEVFEGSSAEEMGLKEGDVIRKIDGEKIEDVESLVNELKGKEVGEKVEVEYSREKKKAKTTGELSSKADYVGKIEKDAENEHLITMRLTVEELDQEEITELSSKSGTALDATNSLQLENLRFSPNPNNGEFELSFHSEQSGDLEIRIFDQNGRVITSETIEKFSGDYSNRFDIQGEPAGLYFVAITQNGKGKTARIVKQ